MPVTNINAAAVDSVLFGVAKRFDRGPIEDVGSLRGALDALFANEAYAQAIGSLTADEDSVTTRLSLSAEAFSGIT